MEQRTYVPDDIVINAYNIDVAYVGEVKNIREMYIKILDDTCYESNSELCNTLWYGYMNILINDVYYYVVIILVIIGMFIIFN